METTVAQRRRLQVLISNQYPTTPVRSIYQITPTMFQVNYVNASPILVTISKAGNLTRQDVKLVYHIEYAPDALKD